MSKSKVKYSRKSCNAVCRTMTTQNNLSAGKIMKVVYLDKKGSVPTDRTLLLDAK